MRRLAFVTSVGRVVCSMGHPPPLRPMPVSVPTERRAIESRQLEQLRAMLDEVLPRNDFQRERLREAGVSPSDIQSLGDLAKLPLTTKVELAADQAAHPPYGSNLTYPPARYARLHQTSGTTGAPLRWLDTPESWARLLFSWEQLFGLMGLRPDDRLFFAFSFGPFLGFWAGFEGANRLGNLCLAGGGMSTTARLKMILDNAVTIVGCTPTYALRLAEVAAEEGVDLANASVRALLVAGEPGGNIPATRHRLEQAWGASVFDHWGMTELGPLAIETPNAPGALTVLETDCIAEIIETQSGQPVPPGTEGELVITTLTRWGSPLLRYRTGDRVCARPGSGLLTLEGGILGRVDEMLTIRGNNLYPSALEDVIRQFAEVLEFRIEVRDDRAMQHVRVEVEPVSGAERLEELCRRIGTAIRDRWSFQAEVVCVTGLPRFEMKARRFFRL